MVKNLFLTFSAKFELGQFLPSYEKHEQMSPPDWLVDSIKSGLVADATNVAICHYCLGNKKEAKRYAEKCVKHALEYFYGAWRGRILTDLKTLDPGWWRIHASWVCQLSEALCWATSLGDWKSAKLLAEYPTSESKPGGATREDAAACFALASLLRGSARSDYEACFGTIQKGKKEKPKLIADVVRALQAKNADEFQKCLEAYLRYFRKSEFKKTSLDKLLCLDGTTLLNLGLHMGLGFSIPPEVEDHIICLK
jgi:tetratricopeptide (TPR) repeat protein